MSDEIKNISASSQAQTPKNVDYLKKLNLNQETNLDKLSQEINGSLKNNQQENIPGSEQEKNITDDLEKLTEKIKPFIGVDDFGNPVIKKEWTL